jgi:hypothetical protein
MGKEGVFWGIKQVWPTSSASSGSSEQAKPDGLALALCSYGGANPGEAPNEPPWAVQLKSGPLGLSCNLRGGMALADEKWNRMQPALDSLQGVFFKRKRTG